GMHGELRAAGQRASLAELLAQGVARPSATHAGAFAVPILPGARVFVSMGKSAFAIASVPRPARQRSVFGRGVERRVLAFVAGSALAHMSLWALLRVVPEQPQALALDGEP